MVKFLAGSEKTLPMKLADGNCHAESVAGYLREQVRGR